MTHFRPCIDLHAGSVKQIVGGTLSTTTSDLKTNFTSEHPAAFYAELYRKHDLRGGHVIMLGPGNDEAAREALRVWPGRLQVGGGIRDENAGEWIEAGAERVGFLLLFHYINHCDIFLAISELIRSAAVGRYHFFSFPIWFIFLGETSICSQSA